MGLQENKPLAQTGRLLLIWHLLKDHTCTGPGPFEWVETPHHTSKAADVAMDTLKQYPNVGPPPASIQIDDGPAHISKVRAGACKARHVTWKSQVLYRPPLSGRGEMSGLAQKH